MLHEDLVNKVRELLSGMLKQRGIELVELSYRRQNKGMVLRFLVDKTGGISLDECSRLNHEINRVLDNTGIINARYMLEVSSPGLDRPLKTKQDFIRAIGRPVKVITRLPVDGKQEHSGELKGIGKKGKNIVIINEDDQTVVIPVEDITRARLEF
ncbi:MAG: ribosome maturation factor RimP [Candidatus Omnitrophota bacterium]|nr:ribosome maturation factor RimP [Candidatus Omnitrophota bacterium]